MREMLKIRVSTNYSAFRTPPFERLSNLVRTPSREMLQKSYKIARSSNRTPENRSRSNCFGTQLTGIGSFEPTWTRSNAHAVSLVFELV
jgi:hypothetical protein